MSTLVIKSLEEFESYIGKDLGESAYLKITQEMINKFAEATLDHQWIHTDPERAKNESPYKTTIAHGYLTLSVLPYLWYQIVDFKNVKLMVNYGIENLKFGHPVLVDNELKLRVKLISIKNLRGIAKAQMKAVLEIKDNPKQAMEADIIFLYHFE